MYLVELICELLPGYLVAVLCCASSTASSREYALGMHAMAHCWLVLLRRQGCNATLCRKDDACVNAHRDATPLFSAVGYHGMPSCMHLRPGLSELFRSGQGGSVARTQKCSAPESCFAYIAFNEKARQETNAHFRGVRVITNSCNGLVTSGPYLPWLLGKELVLLKQG